LDWIESGSPTFGSKFSVSFDDGLYADLYEDNIDKIISKDVEYLTEAKELSSGIFWVITDDRKINSYKFLYFNIPCDVDGSPTGTHEIAINSKNGTTYNHKNTWEDEVKNNSKHRPYNKKDYDYYPRGRIQITNKRADIYINPNINRPKIIDDIKKEFGLSSYNIQNIRVMADNSNHYQCWIDREHNKEGRR
jgi:hypothetical protein